MGKSYKQDAPESLFIKMEGRQVYRYAVTYVPELVNNCLKKAGIPIEKVDHFLFHQANEKMIIAMAEKLFKMNNIEGDIDALVPMSVQFLGNSSVATIPTLMDLIHQEQIPNRYRGGGNPRGTTGRTGDGRTEKERRRRTGRTGGYFTFEFIYNFHFCIFCIFYIL